MMTQPWSHSSHLNGLFALLQDTTMKNDDNFKHRIDKFVNNKIILTETEKVWYHGWYHIIVVIIIIIIIITLLF